MSKRHMIGEEALRGAVLHGDLENVRNWIEKKKVNPNSVGEAGMSSAHIAAANGQLSILRYLLAKAELDLRLRCHSGKTPIYYAAENGCAKVVQFLLNCGVDAEKCCKKNKTPLSIAITEGHKAVADMIQAYLEVSYAANAGDYELEKKLVQAASPESRPLFIRGTRIASDASDGPGMGDFVVEFSPHLLKQKKKPPQKKPVPKFVKPESPEPILTPRSRQKKKQDDVVVAECSVFQPPKPPEKKAGFVVARRRSSALGGDLSALLGRTR